MPAGYTPLPNPRSNPEREMADAFDLDDDVDDHHSAHETTPLTHDNNQPSSATSHVFPRETTSIPGTYDFEREYDFPPPGSPPSPSSRALPNDFGNSNGLLPMSPIQIPKPRVSFFRRAVGAILPTHYARVPTTEAHLTRPTGGGIENDGVFANVTAKPQRARVVQTDDGGIYVAPENSQDQGPPSYLEAQADAVPPYWETTIHAPAGLEPGADMIIDDLPTGSFLIFCLNVFISFFFQFIGFLLTYLLHTTHAAKYGSRAGLGLTLIQYGFYSRVAGDAQSPLNESSSERSELGGVPNGSPTTPMLATPNQHGMSPASKDWLSFLFMTLGWFLLLTSIIGFWRVKRWEQSVRPAVVPSTVEQVEDRDVLGHVFGISQPPEDNQSRERPTTPATPTQSALSQARLARDLRAAGLL
ncbi:hypothetical protein BYT27DRAFT_7233704 [Phlegmacium glaucopus]|nr:hypothetical protein BYT27DRAFT_7233704 [Phlegmacium glaucopus]